MPFQVAPIARFPEAAIDNASTELVTQHFRNWPQACTHHTPAINTHLLRQERILRQKHSIRSVPVSQASFTWKDQTKSYFVYGLEKRVRACCDARAIDPVQVHAPEYPHQCCCGLCSII